jgi:bacterioferritin
MQGDFVSDLNEIRRRARQHVEEGAVTPGYRANREVVLNLLNEALATEIVCTLRYKRHYFMARGLFAETVAAEFLLHAQEEQAHADRISERIVQLGGAPDLNPSGLLTRSASEYQEGEDLVDMVKENLIAERIAIDTYKNMILYVGENDPTTRRMLEDILQKEEEHADDLSSMMQAMGNDKSQRGS